MDINSISNSGDGNIFNQNIGSQTIYGISDINTLAQEWCHRKKVHDEAFHSRMKVSTIQIVVALILFAFSIFIAWAAGDFSSLFSFISFLRDLSISAIGTIVTFLGGLFLAVLGGSRFYYQTEVEKRNKEAMSLIDSHAVDLGFTKKQWRNAKKHCRPIGICPPHQSA